jgi:hypothetical protein
LEELKHMYMTDEYKLLTYLCVVILGVQGLSNKLKHLGGEGRRVTGIQSSIANIDLPKRCKYHKLDAKELSKWFDWFEFIFECLVK